jgi:hypothetical protein
MSEEDFVLAAVLATVCAQQAAAQIGNVPLARSQ